jgi:cytochrome c-type biogenesis protein
MAAVTSVPDDVWNQELRDLKRARFRLADYRDKVVVVNLWATWCGPCRSELPELENLSKEYAAHGVQFIGLTTENPEMDAAKVEKFVRDAKLTYRIGWLDRQSAGALTRGRNLIPQTFVITGDGQVVGHLVGYNSSRSERLLRAAVKRALKENAADEQ